VVSVDPAQLIDRLERQPRTIVAVVRLASPEQCRWKPADRAWSILEVVAHLLDEEREDFRTRLGLLLDDPDAEWPPINPERWASDRDYGSWGLDETLAAFLEERRSSVRWLRSLDRPHWDRTKTHPQAGAMTAGDLLGAWVTHDLLHTRQLIHLHGSWVQALAAPHRTRYAGAWGDGRSTGGC
jgi:hypothetical protein